jgi:uncharacterized repeat protein (TIGR01451 family)
MMLRLKKDRYTERFFLRRIRSRVVFRVFLFFVYSAVALQSSRIHAAVTNYTDPSGYPAAWPSALTTQSYTRFGSAQSDKTSGESDVSKNANPTQSSDFASQSATSIFSYGDGTNLYFRIRVDGFPLQTGSNEPFTGNTWNILFDTDGDGWKEWAVMLHGLGSGDSQPDDIVVIYSDSTSQKFNTGSNVVWRQDSAGPGTNGSDGETGSLSTWDSNPNSYIWDYGRTRVVQIDTTLTPGDNASDYYIDIQAPLAAFDAGGGMTLTSSTWFTFVVTTSASSTDPTGTDLLFNCSFTMSDVRLPTGDVTKGNGTIQQAPIIASMKNTLVCPKDTIKVYVLDALDVVSGSAASSIDSVKIEYYTDVDGDSLIDDSSTWLPLGKATLTAGTLNEWKFVWDVSVHANKNYFVRATAWDKQGNKTVSTSQSPSVTTIVANACAAVPAFDASTKGFQDVVEPVAATSTVRYVLTIRNNGSGSATNVTVRDTLDTYLKFFNFVTGQGTGCTVDSTSVPGRYIVNCALGTMGAG